ncbi:glycoside hydrolase family 38 C-terminal domain-containing protein [Roseisolibacter sp. H3M3-2]|uniref:glycoside hydrolase family 38 N-terminal domain-containing protein n=1 Tax=Roseisolibacter sp. H3M3-2 TaxID=3031323 RepID=UPI0023D9ABF1|nr:glycoside hydrolase family 38 C-terminal domain-containing protein [Roseisolibacter sp. H3M3-2]MDF1503839.1 glycoside hydrolase family 38 C-terminal domain-containing protein [Roseisolibacter sp. H3M3-2]
MASAPDVLLVPHTHWDREWYHPLGRFRQRLVALVDERLDAADDAPFLLDGQAVVLEDYLAVRPERRDDLVAALRSGRLEAGPWYVLADQLIPAGEAHVRNLLAGRRALAALGAAAPPVLYSPDAFGHAAATPTLAAGFGFTVAVVWRGYGGARWPAGDAAWWQGPDGSAVPLLHLPPDGYEFGSRLPPDDAGARARWAAMHAVLAPRARLEFLLVLNGADHHARQERWVDAVAALGRAAAPSRVAVTTLAGLAARVRDAANGRGMPIVAGELRDSYGYTWTLQGTFGTRAAQKRRVAGATRRLVRDVEPWLALARLAGREGGSDAALLHAAWRPLLRCLPHDTLCGCSTDEVARAMDARLDDTDAQARVLRDDLLAALTGHDAVEARARRDAWASRVEVRNRAARPRGGVAELSLLGKVRDVGVGPGSARAWRPVHEGHAPLPAGVQLLERLRRHDRLESARHYPDDDLVDEARALAWVPPLPGYAVASPALDAAPPAPVSAENLRLSNGRVTVEADARGHLRVRFEGAGVTLDDCLGFEDVGDAGDTYTASPVGAARTTLWCVSARLAHRGPLRGAIALDFRMRVPAALLPADDGFSRPTRAGRGHVELPIEVVVSLDAGADWVRVAVRGENRARDHRLRVAFRTGIASPDVRADAAFGPVRRAPLEVSPEDRAMETPPPTAPLHRWVSCGGGAHAATLVSDGLAEYEAAADGRLLVTLVRAVGELSRPDLPERPGNAGWPVPTPEAQCLGPFEAALALAVHAPWGAGTASLVERLADDVLLPLVGTTRRDAVEPLAAGPRLELEGDGLAFSAALPTDDGAVALRCVNVEEAPTEGAWLVGGPLREAWLARMDGTPLSPLTIEPDGGGSRVRFQAARRAVVTVVVRR